MEHTTVLIGNQGECMKVSEKRFIIVKSIENLYAIVDKERADKEQILILSLHKEQVGVVCDLLNEQQSKINAMEKENDELKKQVEDCKDYNSKLYANYLQKDRGWIKRVKRLEAELEESIKENVKLRELVYIDDE